MVRTREFLAAFADGRLESLGDFFSDDVVWHVGGRHPLSGDYVGREALTAYFLRARDESGGSLQLTPSAILANDEHVAISLRVTGERNGRTLDYQGHAAIRDFFIHLGQVTEGTMRLEMQDMLADDDHAVMFWRVTAERRGNALDASGARAFRLDADGKISESWFLYSDQRAYDAFYA